jgi:hypothetical protein
MRRIATLLLGCAALGAATSETRWIKEAKLPENFPGPGPINEVVIKAYPPYRSAESVAFMPLFRHIQREAIPMTTPVEQTPVWDDRRQRWRMVDMGFVYPSTDTGSAGADGRDGRVVTVDYPSKNWLAITRRGSQRSTGIERARKALITEAEAQGLEIDIEALRVLSYNSPFVPGFLSVWEVQVPITAILPVTTTETADR